MGFAAARLFHFILDFLVLVRLVLRLVVRLVLRLVVRLVRFPPSESERLALGVFSSANNVLLHVRFIGRRCACGDEGGEASLKSSDFS